MSEKDDQDRLWRLFIQSVKPLPPKNISMLQAKKNYQIPLRKIEIAPLDLPSFNELVPLVPLQLTNRKIKLPHIEATLDLHGVILKKAYPILVKFIEVAFFYKNRVILIITGKSLKKASEPGNRLVDMVPLWLNSPLLQPYVKKVSFAKKEHGGEGAFYVFLKI